MPPQLALTYFDMPGRARVLRKALALGAVAFEDRALASAQIAALKPALPYGMVPVLSVDDENASGARVVAEAQAILRYIGRLTGAYPPASEPLACALVDELLDSFDDIYERLLMPTLQEDDATVKRAMREKLVDADGGALYVALARIDARLQQLPAANAFLGACASSQSVLIHELVVWDYATTLRSGHFDHIPTTFVDAFPTIVATFDKVERATPRTTPNDSAVSSAASKTVTPPKLKLMSLTADDDASVGPDRAEPLRLALRASGLAFEDERVSRGAFRALQPALPNGQLPVLEIGGQRYAQSQALLRLVGTLGGLYPADDARAAAQVDELLSHLNELYFFFDPVYQDSRPEEKAGIREALADDVVPESLAALDARLAQWQRDAGASPPGPFALGGATPTVADVAIAALVAQLSNSPALAYMPRDVTAPHTRVLAVSAALRDWMARKAA